MELVMLLILYGVEAVSLLWGNRDVEGVYWQTAVVWARERWRTEKITWWFHKLNSLHNIVQYLNQGRHVWHMEGSRNSCVSAENFMERELIINGNIILYNVRVLDQFRPPLVPCYSTEDSVRIGNSFITIPNTRNYNHSQLCLTLLCVYTIKILHVRN
jgi:hypothetical protein